MLKQTTQTVMHSYPGMVALVTTGFEGNFNIMAAGWHSYISYNPPIYGVAIGRERHTYELLQKAGEFAINFLPFECAELIQKAGTLTGQGINKLEHLDIDYKVGQTVQAPIISQAYIAYECKTIDRNSYGDHDWFVGEITQFHKDFSRFDENGLPNWEHLSIPLYLGRSQYLQAGRNSIIKHIK